MRPGFGNIMSPRTNIARLTGDYPSNQLTIRYGGKTAILNLMEGVLCPPVVLNAEHHTSLSNTARSTNSNDAAE